MGFKKNDWYANKISLCVVTPEKDRVNGSYGSSRRTNALFVPVKFACDKRKLVCTAGLPLACKVFIFLIQELFMPP